MSIPQTSRNASQQQNDCSLSKLESSRIAVAVLQVSFRQYCRQQSMRSTTQDRRKSMASMPKSRCCKRRWNDPWINTIEVGPETAWTEQGDQNRNPCSQRIRELFFQATAGPRIQGEQIRRRCGVATAWSKWHRRVATSDGNHRFPANRRWASSRLAWIRNA